MSPKFDGYYTVDVDVDTSKARAQLDQLVERIAAIEIPEFEETRVEEYEFPWWTFILSSFIGGMVAFGVLWVLVLVFA